VLSKLGDRPCSNLLPEIMPLSTKSEHENVIKETKS